MSGTFLFCQALSSAWPAHQPPRRPAGSRMASPGKDAGREASLLYIRRFLPSFLKWDATALPALSWLMRAHLAIFSPVFLKRGCKLLLVPLHSPSGEQEGAAAVG